jgi:acetyl esterase/lipase
VTVADTTTTTPELNNPARYQPPVPRRDGEHLVWPDVIVGELYGYRPLMLDLFRPEPAGRAYPLVVWIHGGAFREGTNKRDGEPLAGARIGERILAAGFALARVTYRLTGESIFPAQLHDVKAAVRWLRHHAAELGLDTSRFAVWGESAGGQLAAILALTGDDPDTGGNIGILESSDAVQAGVIWYSPSDLLTMQSQALADSVFDHDAPDSPAAALIGGPVQDNPELARRASPIHYARADAPPLLLVHGTDDHVVPAQQSTQLHQRLVELGAPAHLETVPGADHCFVGADLNPLVDNAIAFLHSALDGA